MSDQIMAESSPVRIHNSLADLFILVGLDDNTSLIPVNKTDAGTNIDLDELYTEHYEPQVLTALSATTMMHFFPFPRQDMEYPSINLQEAFYCSTTDSSSQQSRFLKRTQGKQLRTQSVTPANITRLMSIRWPQGGGRTAANNTHSQFSFSNLDFPVSEEVIKSITTFCFPDNMKIYAAEPENFAHFLVLTDMSGDKSYATCMTFCRTFIVEKNVSMHVSLSTGNSLCVNKRSIFQLWKA
ncbi:uncharacterized protein [Argopecten irradians]|uniref:uncharacterized protein n=1 Tax=Argopecten irradians TaxID=31199 RepID=UPI003712BFF4